MEPKFEVGEIAIINIPTSTWHGLQVTITSPLRDSTHKLADGSLTSALVHTIQAPWLAEVCKIAKVPYVVAMPRHLKKIPPKQDWIKLCQLNDIPKEVVTT